MAAPSIASDNTLADLRKLELPRASTTFEEVEASSFKAMPKVPIDDLPPVSVEGGDWRCEECNVSFLRREHLVRHNRRHENSHCQACPLCERTLHRSDHMRYHLMQHFDVRPYECLTCHKRYRQAYSLSRHQQKTGHAGQCEHHFDVDEMVAERLAQRAKQPQPLSAPEPLSPLTDDTDSPADGNPARKRAKRGSSIDNALTNPHASSTKSHKTKSSGRSSSAATTAESQPELASAPATPPSSEPMVSLPATMALAVQMHYAQLQAFQMQMLRGNLPGMNPLTNPLLASTINPLAMAAVSSAAALAATSMPSTSM
eukprot:TRINITY_DN139_c0_g1_i1.p1 TRINITY_DN139_c0_g1~~TRINITY_DN139_c0_g1_i1.p1  ORF type:complete len:347 (+),score=76.44 TRINITY_DN139_c0_g1_i1:99-1043(+)